jgi:hypothetical protein
VEAFYATILQDAAPEDKAYFRDLIQNLHESVEAKDETSTVEKDGVTYINAKKYGAVKFS